MAYQVPTDYPEEVIKWMRLKEMKQPPYEGNSPQIKLRGALVDFIRQVCDKLKQSLVTTYLAVHLMDQFMDSHNISDNQLRLSGLAVVLLAAKFEEKDSNIPRVSDLNIFAENRYSVNIFNRMEAFMLKFFEWQVGFATAAHFAEFYLMYAVIPDDYEYNMDDLSSSQIHRHLWDATKQYLDISLQDVCFLKFKYSEIAAACMACGRIKVFLNPPWPISLEVVTGYTFQDLEVLISLLHKETGEKYPTFQTPESGYRSRSSTVSPESGMNT